MRVFEVREQFGNCLELVSMDPNFHNITDKKILLIFCGVVTIFNFEKSRKKKSRKKSRKKT